MQLLVIRAAWLQLSRLWANSKYRAGGIIIPPRQESLNCAFAACFQWLFFYFNRNSADCSDRENRMMFRLCGLLL
jgi:hypothetical protein